MDIRTDCKVKIYSVGTYLPKQIVKSDDLFSEFKSDKRYDIPINWMSENMGIIERRMAPDSAIPSDLAIPAAQQALDNCDVNPNDIDLVIFCGIERDQPEPATAHKIQHAVGVNARHAFDVANACFGFMDGIEIATNYIKSGAVKYAMVVTGEVPSKVIRATLKVLHKGVDKQQAKKLIGLLSVGDAGGAVILGPSYGYNSSGFEIFNTISASRHERKCYYRIKSNGEIDGQMLMANLSVLMIKEHTKLITQTLDNIGWQEFDWMLSHQIGQRPFDQLSKIKGIENSKMIKTFDKLGNITSATFPVNFQRLCNSDTVKCGQRIGGCFAGSGIAIGQFGYTF